MRSVIGAALQEAALDPMLTGRDHLRLQATLQGISRAERKPRAQELLERVGLDRGGRSQGRRLLGRHEAPARPRARARAPAADHLPRRADHRARHPEPHRPLGRGRAARPRGRRHRLPDDAVPRGGRRARRTGSGSSTTGTSSPRGRRHALKAEIGLPSVHAIPVERGRPRAARRRARPLRRVARRRHRRGRRPAPRGARRARRRSSAPSTTRASRSPTSRSRRPRSTTSSSPRPAARWRAPATTSRTRPRPRA